MEKIRTLLLALVAVLALSTVACKDKNTTDAGDGNTDLDAETDGY